MVMYKIICALIIVCMQWIGYILWKRYVQRKRMEKLSNLKLQFAILKRGFKINSCDAKQSESTTLASLMQTISNNMQKSISNLVYTKQMIVNSDQTMKLKTIISNVIQDKNKLLAFIKAFEKKHDVDIMQRPSLDKGHLIIDVDICPQIQLEYLLYMKLYGPPPITGWEETKIQYCIQLIEKQNALNNQQCNTTVSH